MPKTCRTQGQCQATPASKKLDARAYCYVIIFYKIIYVFDVHEDMVQPVTDSDLFVSNVGSDHLDRRGAHCRRSQYGTVFG